MTITFDPNPTFDELMAAFDKAERECSPSVVNIVLDLEIADLFADLADKGVAVLIANRNAWCESAEVSGTDPRFAWSAEAALETFFCDRDSRDEASAAIRASEAGW